MADLPRRRWPCSACPWKRETADRMTFSNLANYAAGTCGTPGNEAPIGAEMFACHRSATDPNELCAGWLAAVGYFHLSVRLAIAMGVLPADALTPGEGWPELYGSYDELAAANGADDA